jgi:indole-3-glycerol phosphate synthase
MMSADWSRDQVELAAFHGADVVLLIGPVSVLAVRTAVEAARRYGMTLVLDVPHVAALTCGSRVWRSVVSMVSSSLAISISELPAPL